MLLAITWYSTVLFIPVKKYLSHGESHLLFKYDVIVI